MIRGLRKLLGLILLWSLPAFAQNAPDAAKAAEDPWAIAGLGRAAVKAGQYEEAVRHMESAVAVAAGGGDALLEGTMLALLGRVHSVQANAEAAQTHYVAAFEKFRSSVDWEPAVRLLRRLAAAEGHIPARSLLREQALELTRQHSSKLVEGVLLKEWGDALFAEGDLATALARLNEAEAALTSAESTPQLAGVLVSIGKVHRSHGSFTSALDQFERALQLMQKADDRIGESQALQHIGITHLKMGDKRTAIGFLEEAVTVARGVGRRQASYLRLVALGYAYVDAGEYRRAIELLEPIEEEAPPGVRPIILASLTSAYVHLDRPDTAASLASRGIEAARRRGSAELLLLLLSERARAFRNLRQNDNVIRDVREALALLEQLKGRLVPLDFMKRGFMNQYLRLVNLAVDVLFESGQAAEAFDIAETARARSFLDLLATRNTYEDADDEGFDIESIQGSAASPDEPFLLSTVAALPATSAGAAALARRFQSTVLAYWVNPDSFFVWVVGPDGVAGSARRQLSGKQLGALVEKAGERNSANRPVWQALYQELAGSIRQYLPRPGSRLTIIPHGPLFRLPFAALIDSRGRYFLEDYALHYAPATALFELISGRKKISSAPYYLLMADPTEPPRLSDGTRLPSLAGSQVEVERIAGLAPRGQPRNLTGAKLRHSEVRKFLGESSVVHFATHAVIDEKQPLDSFLALSYGERLMARDVYDLTINADLVVLSACRGAAGPISAEGVLGLTRAFFYSGALSVIASTWDVADEPSALLVSEFYREYRRTGQKDRALRAAQIRIINDLRHGLIKGSTPAGPLTLPEYPSLWAGFVLLGNPE